MPTWSGKAGQREGGTEASRSPQPYGAGSRSGALNCCISSAGNEYRAPTAAWVTASGGSFLVRCASTMRVAPQLGRGKLRFRSTPCIARFGARHQAVGIDHRHETPVHRLGISDALGGQPDQAATAAEDRSYAVDVPTTSTRSLACGPSRRALTAAVPGTERAPLSGSGRSHSDLLTFGKFLRSDPGRHRRAESTGRGQGQGQRPRRSFTRLFSGLVEPSRPASSTSSAVHGDQGAARLSRRCVQGSASSCSAPSGGGQPGMSFAHITVMRRIQGCAHPWTDSAAPSTRAEKHAYDELMSILRHATCLGIHAALDRRSPALRHFLCRDREA